MKKTIFKGAATAIITPMNNDGSVNFEQLKNLVDSQIAAGIDALVVCGTTGEKSTLNYKEHVDVIKAVVDYTNKRVPVIAGAGSNDTAYSVGLCQEAIDVGADALLMVTPYYNKTSQAGLVAHYTYVADRVDAPIIVYNVPSRTGVNIQPETYAELAKHKNIVAAKEANGDIASVVKTRFLCGDDLAIYSGNDDQIVPMLSVGGSGVISVLSNVAPADTHKMCAEYFAGNVKEAADLQIKYISLINALFSDVNPIPVKEALNIMGFAAGPCRLPLVPMSDAKRAALADELKKVGLVK
ncbi:MAG: 4-hydroxy-tetrahydrodipicolinate synthase [Clostridia bacterium]|nr:4-hydroxy-tetrahydrodipicolinate synthase [Clostridia bacterium]